MGVTNTYVISKQKNPGNFRKVVTSRPPCPWCGASLEGRRPNVKFCSEEHRNAYNHAKPETVMQLSLSLFGVPAAKAEPKQYRPALISERTVRKEDGLKDYKRTPHVHKFYPPAFRCVCGKQQGQPAAIRARVVFVPAAQQAGD
jgi:hypothetical protein